MKKVLGLLGTIIIGIPAAVAPVACNSSFPVSPTYNSIADGIKELKVNSYTKPGIDLDAVINGIKTDILMGIIKLNFAKGITFDMTKFDLSGANIFNIATNQPLAGSDFNGIKILNLEVSVSYNNALIPVKSVTLNIVNVTNKEVSDYIKNFDFNSIFLSANFPPIFYTYSKVEVFKAQLESYMIKSLGSFTLCFDVTNITWNSLKKDSKPLMDNDLKNLDPLSFTLNYTYLNTPSQDINIRVNLYKYNLANITSSLLNDITVNLGPGQNPNNLTQNDVEKIFTTIKGAVMTSLNNIYQTSFSTILTQESDIDILGFNQVAINADFSAPVTVNYTINAKLTSILVTNSIANQSVKVTATAN